MKAVRSVGLATAAGLAAVLSVGSVSGLAAARTPPASAASAPSGYVIERASFTAPGGMLTSAGQASCPSGKVVWGGGVGFESFYDNDTLNTSEASGTTGWFATVNNPDTSSTTFGVDAVCARQPSEYQTVSTLVDDPAGTQATGAATCPTGTVLLSGSVTSHGDTNSEYLTSEWPSSTRTFKASQENASTGDQTFDVAALCAKKPAGYAIVKVHASATPGEAGVAEPACASGTSILGGGVHVAPPQPGVNPTSSIDNDSRHEWFAEVENGTSSTVSLTGYAICAS